MKQDSWRYWKKTLELKLQPVTSDQSVIHSKEQKNGSFWKSLIFQMLTKKQDIIINANLNTSIYFGFKFYASRAEQTWLDLVPKSVMTAAIM